MLSEEVVVDDEDYFLRFVAERGQLEEWARRVEVEAECCSPDLRKELIAGLGKVHNPK